MKLYKVLGYKETYNSPSLFTKCKRTGAMFRKDTKMSCWKFMGKTYEQQEVTIVHHLLTKEEAMLVPANKITLC